MENFSYEVDVNEESAERATRKINAACAIMDVLSTEEMEKLVQLAHDSDKLAQARAIFL